jgi:proteic killer suppression protein
MTFLQGWLHLTLFTYKVIYLILGMWIVKRFVQVTFSNLANKQLKRMPVYIQEAVNTWIESLIRIGISETRKSSGYHDEPFKGNRYGQRSIRLNRSYRVIYTETPEGNILLIVIMEVNKHEY